MHKLHPDKRMITTTVTMPKEMLDALNARAPDNERSRLIRQILAEWLANHNTLTTR